MTKRSLNTQTLINKNITGITNTHDYILFSDAKLGLSASLSMHLY